MGKRISDQLLRALRNDISTETVIRNILCLPTKIIGNMYRFSCPICQSYHTAVNKETNLARCFDCNKNFNPIDMVITVTQCSFVDAVEFLKKYLSD